MKKMIDDKVLSLPKEFRGYKYLQLNEETSLSDDYSTCITAVLFAYDLIAEGVFDKTELAKAVEKLKDYQSHLQEVTESYNRDHSPKLAFEDVLKALYSSKAEQVDEHVSVMKSFIIDEERELPFTEIDHDALIANALEALNLLGKNHDVTKIRAYLKNELDESA